MPHREIRSWSVADYGFLLNQRNVKIGAEVGVLTGQFTDFIKRHAPNIEKMYLIDPWKSIDGWTDIANASQEVMDLRYQLVKAMFPTDTILRMTSVEAAPKVNDGELDFVYLDARHDYMSIKEDINLWYPKVKNGGIFSGHDYDLQHPGVVSAVHEFINEHGIDLTIFAEDQIWVITK